MTATKTSPARKSGGEYLNHELPSEMIAEIGKYLDLNSKLKLRLALVRARQADVVEMLKETLKVLYFPPSRKSMRKFKQICQCTFFQQHIIEVVFLPKVLVIAGDVQDRYKGFQEYITLQTIYRSPTQEAYESWQIYQSLVDEHWWSVEETDLDVKKTLAEGLGSLRLLQTATVSPCIAGDGINKSIIFLDQFWDEVTELDRPSECAQMVLREELTDQGVYEFFSAIDKAGRSLHMMRFGVKDYVQLNFDIQENSFCGQPELPTSVASNLLRLHFNCKDSDNMGIVDEEGQETSAFWWRQLATDAFCLQELEICTGLFHGAEFDDESHGCKVIDHFLRHGKFPWLRNLAIRGPLQEDPSIVDSALLKDFLARHASTLRKVSISDILPSTGKERSADDVKATFKSLLSLVLPDMKTFEWSLYRCAEQPEDECECEGKEYQHTYAFPKCEVLVQDFDELAEELEIVPEDEGWDFGKVLMRSAPQSQ